jgi:hypothetical protein
MNQKLSRRKMLARTGTAVSLNPANGDCRGTIRGPAALELSL